MSDIVERLKGGVGQPHLCVEAAAEIERLRDETAMLKSAMRVNAMRWQPNMSHEQIDAWIDGIAKPVPKTSREPVER